MNYVLGGGIAGLVYAHAHPDYMVIADSPGGAMASQLPIGPRYIHATANSTQLIQELGLPHGKRVTVKSLTLGPDSERQYNFKTRGVSALSYDRTRVLEHEVYDFPTVQDVTGRLIELLFKRIITDKAVRVFGAGGEIVTRDHGVFEYNHLVSTIPLPFFAKLLDTEQTAVSWGGHYIKVPVRFVHHEIYDGSWPWPGVDYVYFAGYDLPYSRMARLEALGKEWVCFEYPGLDSEEPRPVGSYFDAKLDHPMEMSRSVSSVLFPYGRVVTRQVPMETRMQLRNVGISLFGRFAEWDDGLLTHDLIERARHAK